MSYCLISLVFRPFPPPLFDRLQYCLQYRLQIWSRAVTSGRRYPTRNLEALSYTISLRAGGQSVSKAVSIPSVVRQGRFDTKQEFLLSGTTPLSTFCLPDTTLDQIS